MKTNIVYLAIGAVLCATPALLLAADPSPGADTRITQLTPSHFIADNVQHSTISAQPAIAPSTSPAPLHNARGPRRRDGRHAPFTVSWRVKAEGGQNGTTVLLAEITRRWNITVPIAVTVEVPPGVRIAQGPIAFQVPPGAAFTTSTTELRIRYDRAPAQPLRLRAQVQTPTFGANLVADYRFGKPEPTFTPEPQRFGSDLILGRRNLGPSIRMGQ